MMFDIIIIEWWLCYCETTDR